MPEAQRKSLEEMRSVRMERAKKIAVLFQSGWTLQRIGTHYGFTRERARQYLKLLNLTRLDGGQAALSELKKEENRRRFQTTFGCSRTQLNEYRRMGMTLAFRNQKMSARARGIPWKFNIGQWCAFWVASGNLHKRGRNDGEYVMARFNDEGAYEWSNVRIVTCNENIKFVRLMEHLPGERWNKEDQ